MAEESEASPPPARRRRLDARMRGQLRWQWSGQGLCPPYPRYLDAELILRGIKPIEYRTRPTTIIGERFYIYASSSRRVRQAHRWRLRAAASVTQRAEVVVDW